MSQFKCIHEGVYFYTYWQVLKLGDASRYALILLHVEVWTNQPYARTMPPTPTPDGGRRRLSKPIGAEPSCIELNIDVIYSTPPGGQWHAALIGFGSGQLLLDNHVRPVSAIFVDATNWVLKGLTLATTVIR